jgi:hypothetical protein
VSDSQVFGPMINLAVGPSRAVEDFLREWIDTYLAAYERVNELDVHSYSRPQSYLKVNLLEGLPGEDMSPTIIIISRGAANRTEQAGRVYSAPMNLAVAVVTSSFDSDGAREVAGAYGAAIVTAMLHKRNLRGAAYPNGRLDGRLRVLSWDDFRLDDLIGTEARTRALLRLEFSIMVNDVVQLDRGPELPDPPDTDDDPGVHPPPTDLPTVLTTTVNVQKEDT